MENNWYAIYTMPRSEKKVYERLLSLNFSVYLPLIWSVRKWSDRQKKIQLPLIPSYVFVQTTEIDLAKILQLQGVCGVLKHLRKPAIVRDEEIENLKLLLANSDEISMIEVEQIEEGELVEVIKGPFKGVIAHCILIQNKHRIIVGIEGISNYIEINVPLSFVRKK